MFGASIGLAGPHPVLLLGKADATEIEDRLHHTADGTCERLRNVG